MMHFHRWGKWTEYVRSFGVILNDGKYRVQRTEIWQRRECLVCGKAQRRVVADGSGHPIISANNRLADGTLMDSSGATERQ